MLQFLIQSLNTDPLSSSNTSSICTFLYGRRRKKAVGMVLIGAFCGPKTDSTKAGLELHVDYNNDYQILAVEQALY